MDPVRIGLVGYGRFGQLHAQAISQVKGAALDSICVGSRAGVEGAKSSGVSVYSDYDEFLEKGSFDAVDIVSPNHMHAGQASRAISRGFHTLLEKPIAIEPGEAEDLVQIAEASKCIVQVGFQYRQEPFWKEIKRIIESGEIVSPSFAKIESWRGPFRRGSRDWRYDHPRVGHQMLEEAIHYFDLSIWYFGIPERVSGFTDSDKTWKNGLFGSAISLLEYRSGMKMLIGDTLNGILGYTSASVAGQGAMIGMVQPGPDGSSQAWMTIRDKEESYRSPKLRVLEEVEGIRLSLEDFVSAVQTGSEPKVSIKDGYRALRLDLAAIESIGSGAPVKIAEGIG